MTTLKTTITYHPMLRVWHWAVTQGRKTLASGYCRTKRDARNDAGVWVGMHEDWQRRAHQNERIIVSNRKRLGLAV